MNLSSFNQVKQNLEKENSKLVKDTVNNLVANNDFNKELIETIKISKGSKPWLVNWSIIILGKRQSLEAVESIIKVFEFPGMDFLYKAAEIALRQIAEKNPDKVFEKIKIWLNNVIKELNEQNPSGRQQTEQKYAGRAFAYHVLESLAPRKEVKEYLIEKVNQDFAMIGHITLALLRWPLDQNMESFFRRQVELALLNSGGSAEYNVSYARCKWALIYYVKGEFGDKYKFEEADKELEQPWDKIWQPVFEAWDKKVSESSDSIKSNDLKDQKSNADKQENLKKSESKKQIQEQKKARENEKMFRSFEMPKFSIHDYLDTRIRNKAEQGFQDLLDKSEELKKIKVEDVQKDINKKEAGEVLSDLLSKVKDKKEQQEFYNKFLMLFSVTPLEKYSGLTESEKKWFEDLPAKYKGNVGRNDPCPCGATTKDGKPKKYKKCCGRKFV